MKQKYVHITILAYCMSFFVESLEAVIIFTNSSKSKPLRLQIAVDFDKSFALVPGNTCKDTEVKISAYMVRPDITIAPGGNYALCVDSSRPCYVSIAAFQAARDKQVTVQVKEDVQLCIEDLGGQELAVGRNVEIFNKTAHKALISLAYISDKRDSFFEKKSLACDDCDNDCYGKLPGKFAMIARKFSIYPFDVGGDTESDSKLAGDIMCYLSYAFSLRLFAGYTPGNGSVHVCLVNDHDEQVHELHELKARHIFPLSGNKTIIDICPPTKGEQAIDIESLKVLYARLGYVEKSLHPPVTGVNPYLMVKNSSCE